MLLRYSFDSKPVMVKTSNPIPRAYQPSEGENVSSIATQVFSNTPKMIHGLRFPRLEFVLSDKLPTTGATKDPTIPATRLTYDKCDECLIPFWQV